jgi:hypothetical protein
LAALYRFLRLARGISRLRHVLAEIAKGRFHA